MSWPEHEQRAIALKTRLSALPSVCSNDPLRNFPLRGFVFLSFVNSQIFKQFSEVAKPPPCSVRQDTAWFTAPRQGLSSLFFRSTRCLSRPCGTAVCLSGYGRYEVSYASDLVPTMARYTIADDCHIAGIQDLSQLHLNLLSVNLDAVQTHRYHPLGWVPKFQRGEEGKVLRLRSMHLFRQFADFSALAPGHFRGF